MKLSDSSFAKFVSHILSFEGGLSKDERDTASSCAPFKGAYHTNKGVTYCTFQKLAGKLGIENTYQKFISMGNDDVSKFIYSFYLDSHGMDLPDTVALSVTEASWGSGSSRAIKNLQTALYNLGKLDKDDIDGVFGAGTKKAVSEVAEDKLYLEFWKERQRFIDSLTVQSKYSMYKKGWQNRIDSFLKNISPSKVFTATKEVVKKNPIKTIAVLFIIAYGLNFVFKNSK